MKSTKITFLNAQGERLAARLELPEDGAPLAYALFAHCFTCTKDLKAAVHISRAMSSRRIAVLRFDFTGLGESEGDFAETTFSTEVSDLVAAARFLEQEYQAPQLLVGHSLGGTAVLAAAELIPTVKVVVTIAAPFNPSHLLGVLDQSTARIEQRGAATVSIGGAGRNFTIGKGLLDDLKIHEPSEVLRRLNVALLVMHSPHDQLVAIDNATQIFQAASHPKSFIDLDQADHLLSNNRDSHYAGEMIVVWAARYLALSEEPAIAKQPSVPSDRRVTARIGPEGFRTELFANGIRLIADEPIADGGTNEGPSPYDYLLVALGACTAMTVQMYARRKKWPLEEVVVRLSHAKIHADDCRDCDEKVRMIDAMERELELRGDLDESQRQRLLEISGHCPVHRTLTGQVRIDTKLRPE